LCFLVDAFRHDYLREGVTPFMEKLASEGSARPLPTILGYSDSIRATIFTGRYPDQLGYWMEYCFRPERSPFRPLDRLAAFDRFPVDFGQRAAKFALSATLMRKLARSRGYPTLNLRHIPFGALRFFDYTLTLPMTAPGALGAPTIFDRLSAAGKKWSYLDASTMPRQRLINSVRELPKETALVFVYLHQIDMASHLFGLGSARFKRSLRTVDALVAELYLEARSRFGEPSVLVFSDHGMTPIERTVAIPELRRHPAFGKGFVFALDATMVRLWYLRDEPRLRDDLRSLVAGKLPGRFLSRPDRVALHVDFDHNLYGDDIFLTEPGTVIFPNFHSYVRPKAMHAYDPSHPDQDGILIAPDDGLSRDEVPSMVDLAPLVLRLVGIARERERVR
jgi:predicted AlkP superfamily pyrophosphatase or phosphodiesterase